jgi:hypothetical protein
VPYFAGSVGILYDRTKVDEADVEAGWELLRNTKYKGDVYMYDSERDSFMVALKALGYSMNTTDRQEIEEAWREIWEEESQEDEIAPQPAPDDPAPIQEPAQPQEPAAPQEPSQQQEPVQPQEPLQPQEPAQPQEPIQPQESVSLEEHSALQDSSAEEVNIIIN